MSSSTAHTNASQAAQQGVYLGKPKPKRRKAPERIKWADHSEVRPLLMAFMRKYDVEGASQLSRVFGAPLRQCFRWLSPLETNQNGMSPLYLTRLLYILLNVEPEDEVVDFIKKGGFWEKLANAK